VPRPSPGVRVAASLFLCYLLTIGITQYAFGVFVTALAADFGWSRAAINGSLSLFAVSGLLAPLVGIAIDRVGARPVMLASLLALALSQLLRPLMTELWQFYALALLQFAGTPGLIVIPAGKLIGAWFPLRRGRALGFTTMGANVGGVIFSPLAAALVGSIGWRSACIVFGLLFLAALAPVSLWIRERDARDGALSLAAPPGLSAAAAVRTRAFALIVFGLLIAQLTYQSVSTQIVPHLESIGIAKTTAALGLAAMAVAGATGKASFGWATEHLPARYVVAASLAAQITGIVVLVSAGTSWWLWLFIPTYGLGFGALGAIMPLLVQESFGLRAFGSIFGLVNLFTLASSLAGPPVVGVVFDRTGSYEPAFLVIAALFAIAAVALAFARPPALASAAEAVPAHTAPAA
jgi:MFS family permease